MRSDETFAKKFDYTQSSKLFAHLVVLLRLILLTYLVALRSHSLIQAKSYLKFFSCADKHCLICAL